MCVYGVCDGCKFASHHLYPESVRSYFQNQITCSLQCSLTRGMYGSSSSYWLKAMHKPGGLSVQRIWGSRSVLEATLVPSLVSSAQPLGSISEASAFDPQLGQWDLVVGPQMETHEAALDQAPVERCAQEDLVPVTSAAPNPLPSQSWGISLLHFLSFPQSGCSDRH